MKTVRSTQMNSRLKQALWFRKRKISVFPCCSLKEPCTERHQEDCKDCKDGKHGKCPLIRWKEFQDRLPTLEEINRWWTQWPQANIALVTGKISRLFVLDFDGPDGEALLRELLQDKEFRNFYNETTGVKTGRGYQVYAGNLPDGLELTIRARIRPGFDYRFDKGYVIAPGSLHSSGRIYRAWRLDRIGKLPQLPQCVTALLVPSKRPKENKTEFQESWVTEALGGVVEGERNDICSRLSGHFISKRLPLEEVLQIMQNWNPRNSPPLPEEEVERTVQSIWTTHQNNHPGTNGAKSNTLELVRLGDLLQEEDVEIPWLVEKIIPAGYFVGLTSRPKVGKSTLARCLALSVATGQPFLGMTTMKGHVIFISLEETKRVIRSHFKKMGAVNDPDISIFAGAYSEGFINKVIQAVKDLKPVLLILDTLFRVAKVKQIKEYSETQDALTPLLELAHSTECTVLGIHHAPKSQPQSPNGSEDEIELLGSTVIWSSFDSGIAIKQNKGVRTIIAKGRDVDFPETILHFDPITKTVTLGETKEENEISDKLKEIESFLDGREPITEREIWEEIKGRKLLNVKALRKGVEDGRIQRQGAGGKKDPYRYFLGDLQSPEQEPSSRPPTVLKKILVPPVPVYIREQREQELNFYENANKINSFSCSQDSSGSQKLEENREQEKCLGDTCRSQDVLYGEDSSASGVVQEVSEILEPLGNQVDEYGELLF